MPVGVSCFVLLYMCTCTYIVTLYSWHYFYLSLPLPCCVCLPSVLISVLYSVWRLLGKGTLVARVRSCWNGMGSFAVGDLV